MVDHLRKLPEESPVALTFNGVTEAVMMATPCDLADFGIGFALSEGIIRSAREVSSLEVVCLDGGHDVQMSIPTERQQALTARRRKAMGPVGCGLCGIESIEAALRDLPELAAGLRIDSADIAAAVDALGRNQPLRAETGAMHGAGLFVPGKGLLRAREDVGRHNALDKLIGACARDGIGPASGALVISSRVSVDLIQKAVAAGSEILIAVSTPTELAVSTAERTGLTLVALVRGEDYRIFSRPERISHHDAIDEKTAGRNADVA
ncbi:formate dehydrogenase accessory sulfurtransferase FdhD [Pseudohoeflea suaedae]|nr:formate dehydrogenase accessory sulfurtransferase FdhD [Pseudohoeflea suaedae]